ncbi:Solute carrier family 35 member E3 [Cercospora zeina]
MAALYAWRKPRLLQISWHRFHLAELCHCTDANKTNTVWSHRIRKIIRSPIIDMGSTTLTMTEEKSFLLANAHRKELPQWKAVPQRSWIVDALWVALNAVATIVIVFMNKHTLSDPQLRKSQIMMAMWHFSATFLVLLAATHRRWRMFTPVRLPVSKVLPLSAFFAGFLILSNLSLATNPVGFYQLSKILTTPAVIAINFVLFGKRISKDRLLAVLVTCLGVALVSVESFRSNVVGTTIACAAFTTTACYQIWIGKKIVDLDVDAAQLLLNQSATAVCLLIPVSLVFDTMPDFSTIPTETLMYLFGTGLIASFLNLSQFMIIGRTSALTFNVVSNIKMLAILSLGWSSEGKVFSAMDIGGMILAFLGAWQYARETAKS